MKLRLVSGRLYLFVAAYIKVTSSLLTEYLPAATATPSSVGTLPAAATQGAHRSLDGLRGAVVGGKDFRVAISF